jgi:protocatechuate 3,4-dioxygenase beta subunit
VDFVLEDKKPKASETLNSRSEEKTAVLTCDPGFDPDAEDQKVLKGEIGKSGEISGRVVDENGKPLEGVLVDVWHWHPGNETTTDANGHFHLDGFDPDQNTVEIRFSKEDLTPRYIVKQPVGLKEITVVLNGKTYFEGAITDSKGQPVSNAKIRAVAGPKRAEGVMITEVSTETTSDENGNYRLYVQADTYDVQVKTKLYVLRLTGTKIEKDKAMKLDLKLEGAVTFRAKVIDSQTSEPVEGLRLYSWQNPGNEGTSDAEGMISISGMLPGTFNFNVECKNAGRWWSEQCLNESDRYMKYNEETGWQRNFDGLGFDIRSGMEPVTIVVEKPVIVRGKVVDPDGKPVLGATATLSRTGSGNSLTGDTRYSFKTDSDGSFEMTMPASNKAEYNLIAHDGKYNQWRQWANGVLQPIKTKPGEVISDVVLKLTQPGTVKGKVLDSSGSPVADHRVRSHAFDKLGNRYYDPKVRTDAEGNFEIKFIRPGKHYIQAYPFWLTAERGPGHGCKIVTVTGGETVGNIKLFTDEPKEAKAGK